MSFKFNQELDRLDENRAPSLFDYTAGQYAYYELDDAKGDPNYTSRHFTISSSPIESSIMFTAKIRGSSFKETFHRIGGDKVKASKPEGEFVLLDNNTKLGYFCLEV